MKILDLILSVIERHWEFRAGNGMNELAFQKVDHSGFCMGIDRLGTRGEARRWVRRLWPSSRWEKIVVRIRVIQAEEARRDRLERDSKGSVSRIRKWVGCGWERRRGVEEDSLQSEQCCPLRWTFVHIYLCYLWISFLPTRFKIPWDQESLFCLSLLLGVTLLVLCT